MPDTLVPTILWWIAAVDMPLLSGFMMMAARYKRDIDQSLQYLRDALTGYKLEVAQAYASIQQLKDLEARLVAHLLRIETKLENSILPTPRDKG